MKVADTQTEWPAHVPVCRRSASVAPCAREIEQFRSVRPAPRTRFKSGGVTPGGRQDHVAGVRDRGDAGRLSALAPRPTWLTPLNHHRSRQPKFGTVVARDRYPRGRIACAGRRSTRPRRGQPRGSRGLAGHRVRLPVAAFTVGWHGPSLVDEPVFAAAVAELETGVCRASRLFVARRAANGMQLALTELWCSYGVRPSTW